MRRRNAVQSCCTDEMMPIIELRGRQTDGTLPMDRWLEAALDYIPSWLEFQLRLSRQPGCVVAVAHHGEIILERSYRPISRGRPRSSPIRKRDDSSRITELWLAGDKLLPGSALAAEIEQQYVDAFGHP